MTKLSFAALALLAGTTGACTAASDTGTHSDPSNTLRLDGIAHRS